MSESVSEPSFYLEKDCGNRNFHQIEVTKLSGGWGGGGGGGGG